MFVWWTLNMRFFLRNTTYLQLLSVEIITVQYLLKSLKIIICFQANFLAQYKIICLYFFFENIIILRNICNVHSWILGTFISSEDKFVHILLLTKMFLKYLMFVSTNNTNWNTEHRGIKEIKWYETTMIFGVAES